jgi:hypothetical protein
MTSTTLGASNLLLFAHTTIYDQIKNIKQSTICTGIGNVLSNKGGLGVSFEFGGSSYLLVTSHLPSG